MNIGLKCKYTPDCKLYISYAFVMLLFYFFRYGSFEFGINKADVPANFGENAPSAFRKLAVRAVAKVSHRQVG